MSCGLRPGIRRFADFINIHLHSILGSANGSSDDFAHSVGENPVSAHDRPATDLHLLGIGHERFTDRFQGRRDRLTDIAGDVILPLLV